VRGRINPVYELFSVCIIFHGSIDFDGLEVLPVSKPSKSIEPWNIIHTANNSYTGFILPRTYDTHQWLPLQFVNYS